jgi:hypothetical protein
MSKMQGVVWVVAQIKSSQMIQLGFTILLKFVTDLNRVDWETLADILARPNFSRLKRISFSIEGLNPRLGGELIRHKLSACDARGILFIS